MADLFAPITINTIALPNHFIRSATYEGLADEDGKVNDRLCSVYEELAKGNIGLVVVGYAYIRQDGKGGPGMLGIWSDDHIRGLTRLVNAFHSRGMKIASQIVHCGRQTVPALTGGEIVAPSPIPTLKLGIIPRELTISEIEEIIGDFAKAALRAKQAGFDAVQIHCAHGYLLNQFLAPNSNRRADRYGGDIEGRATALFEAYSEIRKVVGDDYPILIKINANDAVNGGLELEESAWVAQRLAEMGIDGVEISGGVWDTKLEEGRSIQKGVPKKRPEGYFMPYVKRFKESVKALIIAVGGIRTLEFANKIVNEEEAELVSMCRPFICEPQLLNRWREGDHSPARCVSCNQCLALTPTEGLQCFKKESREENG